MNFMRDVYFDVLLCYFVTFYVYFSVHLQKILEKK